VRRKGKKRWKKKGGEHLGGKGGKRETQKEGLPPPNGVRGGGRKKGKRRTHLEQLSRLPSPVRKKKKKGLEDFFPALLKKKKKERRETPGQSRIVSTKGGETEGLSLRPVPRKGGRSHPPKKGGKRGKKAPFPEGAKERTGGVSLTNKERKKRRAERASPVDHAPKEKKDAGGLVLGREKKRGGERCVGQPGRAYARPRSQEEREEGPRSICLSGKKLPQKTREEQRQPRTFPQEKRSWGVNLLRHLLGGEGNDLSKGEKKKERPPGGVVKGEPTDQEKPRKKETMSVVRGFSQGGEKKKQLRQRRSWGGGEREENPSTRAKKKKKRRGKGNTEGKRGPVWRRGGEGVVVKGTGKKST